MVHVNRIDAVTWKEVFADDAHKIAFASKKPSSVDKIDFALLVVNGDQPMGYVTCREYDHESLYWQYGGAFPGTKGTGMSWKGYSAMVFWCRDIGKFKRLTTLIENKNTAMLKLAMQVGFRIIGVRVFDGIIYLEHLLEFADVK